jgi:hypothetical protein
MKKTIQTFSNQIYLIKFVAFFTTCGIVSEKLKNENLIQEKVTCPTVSKRVPVCWNGITINE